MFATLAVHSSEQSVQIGCPKDVGIEFHPVEVCIISVWIVAIVSHVMLRLDYIDSLDDVDVV